MADVRALAIRFADLWAVDPHQMVDEIYAPGIDMQSTAHPDRVTSGATELHALETRLAAMIPQHRHELVRVVVAGDAACIESIVVSPTTAEYAPACVWWWLDGNGRVEREIGWFDWSVRSTDSAVAHGTVPADDGRRRGDQAWYRAYADRQAELWSSDPIAMVDQLYAEGCTVGRVGVREIVGLDPLRAAERSLLELLPVPQRWLHVHETLGEGSVLAILFTIGDDTHEARGTIVLTLDADDRIASDRVYWDWNTARPRPTIGSPA